MLKGEYSHNIDPKGRLIIPAKFRDDLGEHFVITKGMENQPVCISGKRMDDLCKKNQNALPTTTDKKARAFAYFFQGSATDGDLDKQGRTLIPSVLREYAKLGKEVVFIGMGVWLNDFYAMPAIVGFLIALGVAFCQNRKRSFSEKWRMSLIVWGIPM